MSHKIPPKWTRQVVLIPSIIALIAASISPNILAFPPINAPLDEQENHTNMTKSVASSPPVTRNETDHDKKLISVSIARGSDSPSNSKFYIPSVVNISNGDKVIWKNDDTTLHTVTSGSPGATNLGAEFDSDYMAAGKTFQHTFNKPGTIDYFCTLHPFMTGEIKVSVNPSHK